MPKQPKKVKDINFYSHIPIAGAYIILTFFVVSVIVFVQFFKPYDLFFLNLIQKVVPPSFDVLLSLFSLLGSFEVVTLILLILGWRKKTSLLWLFGFYGLGLAVELIGKFFIPHPGPPKELYRYSLSFLFPTSQFQTASSYPSGHSFRSVYAAICGGFGIWATNLFRRDVKIIATIGVIVSLLVMLLSRISLGEHWPSDVLGGSLLGLGLGLCAVYALKFGSLPKPDFVKKLF